MRLLKFEASWCNPCKQLSKVMEDMEFPYPVDVIDIDTNRDAVMEFGVRSVPTLILVDDNNQPVTRVGGAVTKEKLLQELGL